MRMPLSPRARNALAKRGGGGGVYRAKLPKKRGKLDCLYYSPFAFDKYGCKCKTGPGSARPETRFHSYSSRPRARIGVTYLAKFLPSRQSHSINSECTYLPRAATCARARSRHVHVRVCVCARRCISRGLPRRLSSLCEYLAKYFTHREIFTHYTPLLSSAPFFSSLSRLDKRGCTSVSLVIIAQPRSAVSNHRVIDRDKSESRKSAPRDFISLETAGDVRIVYESRKFRFERIYRTIMREYHLFMRMYHGGKIYLYIYLASRGWNRTLPLMVCQECTREF